MQLKAVITRQSDITVDGRMGEFGMTINVSTQYLPVCLVILLRFHYKCLFVSRLQGANVK